MDNNINILIEKLLDAQDGGIELYIGYSSEMFSMGVKVVPDLMIVDEWMAITDKRGASDISLQIDYEKADVNHDEVLDEYTISLEDELITIAF